MSNLCIKSASYYSIMENSMSGYCMLVELKKGKEYE